MNRIKEFFRSKAFYIAFGTGILAFSGLMLVYNYSDNREGLKKEQAIDLNQPVDEIVEEYTEEYSEELYPVESDGVLTGQDMGIENETDVTEATETVIPSTTEVQQIEESTLGEDEVIAEVTSDQVVASKYNYNGEQSLAWPLMGDVILPYSMDTTVYFATLKAYKCNPGMLISGSEGADVVSAYDGVVESIVEDKEHGTMINVDMGNGYVCSYGQLMNVTVAEGDEVVLGQNIGEVAPVTGYYTEEGTHLYFEMTKEGQPVNPITYIQ